MYVRMHVQCMYASMCAYMYMNACMYVWNYTFHTILVWILPSVVTMVAHVNDSV